VRVVLLAGTTRAGWATGEAHMSRSMFSERRRGFLS
jgi:hypothetical protein